MGRNIRQKLICDEPVSALFCEHILPAVSNVDLLLGVDGLIDSSILSIRVGWDRRQRLIIVRWIHRVEIRIWQR